MKFKSLVVGAALAVAAFSVSAQVSWSVAGVGRYGAVAISGGNYGGYYGGGYPYVPAPVYIAPPPVATYYPPPVVQYHYYERYNPYADPYRNHRQATQPQIQYHYHGVR